jgi:hypothetical protein
VPASDSSRRAGPAWRVEATGVRERDTGLRWTLQAVTDDAALIVHADSSRAGTVYHVQHGSHDSPVDLELEAAVRQCVHDVCALHTVLSELDQIDGRRRRRSDRLRPVA